MNENELRIWNYFIGNDKILCLSEILHIKECKEWVLTGWHEETKERISVNFFDAEPIPITPEILESCGFKLKEHKWFDGSISDNYYWNGKYNVGYQIFDSIKIYFLGRATNENNSEWLANFKYLHQLQNLYFALTGTELEVNLQTEKIRIEIGVLKSELSELKDKNKNLIYSHSKEVKDLKKEINHHKKGLTTIQRKNVLLKTLIKWYNKSLPPY